MKLRIYLDTSVFSAYYDARVTDRQIETEEFWRRLDQFEANTSELTQQELSQTQGSELKAKLIQLLKEVKILPLTDEMNELAKRYISASVFTPVMFNDALHAAAAVMTRQDILVSWNFKHLVNRRRRAMVNEVNISHGLPTIEIVAPPEI